ncbi:SufD family Fe-S cluster assembly protein [Candidatus Peregrinibacteria bacterium]|nr:SufD family Fe-S cluster assembly protein [Candidatus Peregrinibacteria bacterium]
MKALQTAQKKRAPISEIARALTPSKNTVVIAENETAVLPIFSAASGENILEIFQRPHSKLTFAYIQNIESNAVSVIHIKLFLEEGARAESFIGVFGGRDSRLSIESCLVGRGASLREKTVFFGSENQILSMSSKTILEAPGSAAEVLSKGILTGEAKGAFDGGIHILQSAKQGSARLIEHTLLLSQHAAMHAVPGLTIDTNDVFASHSAGITRIDDEQRFYCESRGIPEKEAVRLIAEGFLKNTMENSPFQDSFSLLIDQKLCAL